MAAALAAAPIPATAPTLQRKRCGSLAPEAWPSGLSTPTQLRLPGRNRRSCWETKAVRIAAAVPSWSWTTTAACGAAADERRKIESSSSPSSTGASPSSTGGAVRTVARSIGTWSSSVPPGIVSPPSARGTASKFAESRKCYRYVGRLHTAHGIRVRHRRGARLEAGRVQCMRHARAQVSQGGGKLDSGSRHTEFRSHEPRLEASSHEQCAWEWEGQMSHVHVTCTSARPCTCTCACTCAFPHTCTCHMHMYMHTLSYSI